jgi:hypothetical protein
MGDEKIDAAHLPPLSSTTAFFFAQQKRRVVPKSSAERVDPPTELLHSPANPHASWQRLY